MCSIPPKYFSEMPIHGTHQPFKRYICSNENGTKFHAEQLRQMDGAVILLRSDGQNLSNVMKRKTIKLAIQCYVAFPATSQTSGRFKGTREASGRADGRPPLPSHPLAHLINGKRCTFLVLTASSEPWTPKRMTGTPPTTHLTLHTCQHAREAEVSRCQVNGPVILLGDVITRIFFVCVEGQDE